MKTFDMIQILSQLFILLKYYVSQKITTNHKKLFCDTALNLYKYASVFECKQRTDITACILFTV